MNRLILAAALISGLVAAGAATMVRADDGDIILLREVAPRPAYRMPLVPSPEVVKVNLKNTTLGALEDADIAGVISGQPLGGLVSGTASHGGTLVGDQAAAGLGGAQINRILVGSDSGGPLGSVFNVGGIGAAAGNAAQGAVGNIGSAVSGAAGALSGVNLR